MGEFDRSPDVGDKAGQTPEDFRVLASGSAAEVADALPGILRALGYDHAEYLKNHEQGERQ